MKYLVTERQMALLVKEEEMPDGAVGTLKYSSKSQVYDMGDSVLKIYPSVRERDYRMAITYFPKNPKVFPKILKVDRNKMWFEKMDAEEARYQFNEIDRIIVNRSWKKQTPLNSFAHYLQVWNHPTKAIPLPGGLNKEQLANAQRFANCVAEVKRTVGKSRFLPDVISRNFGYAADGTLKMLDI